MKNAFFRRGRRQLKRLCASTQSNINQKLFKSLSDLSSSIEGIELPIPNNPGSVLKTSYDADSFTAEVKTSSGHVINKFETFYIEDNEYGESVYDVYVNDNTEEGLEADEVSNAFAEWFNDLRHLVGVVDEESEWRLQNNGTVSQESKLSRSLLDSEFMQEVLDLEDPTGNTDPMDMLYYMSGESYDEFLQEYLLPPMEPVLQEVADNYIGLIEIRDMKFDSAEDTLHVHYRVMDDTDEVFDYYHLSEWFLSTLQDIVELPKEERTDLTVEDAIDAFVDYAVSGTKAVFDWNISSGLDKYLEYRVNTDEVVYEAETSLSVESTLQLNFTTATNTELQRQIQKMTGSSQNEVMVDVDELLAADGNAMQKQLAEFISRNWIVVKAAACCVSSQGGISCKGSLLLQLQRRLGRLR